jgi:type II secretory pathway component PulK
VLKHAIADTQEFCANELEAILPAVDHEHERPTRAQMIGFAQRSSDDAWLNANTHTAEMFAAIANALRASSSARNRDANG